ncbi:hypothetical protein SDC9_89713 [bioreactor metagenome]|uniref:Uncharacterized protein n=1 Tax=bioreactor metagenome TaxID=1076179 RepID=A0A644ZPZ9_9ZZZZ
MDVEVCLVNTFLEILVLEGLRPVVFCQGPVVELALDVEHGLVVVIYQRRRRNAIIVQTARVVPLFGGLADGINRFQYVRLTGTVRSDQPDHTAHLFLIQCPVEGYFDGFAHSKVLEFANADLPAAVVSLSRFNLFLSHLNPLKSVLLLFSPSSEVHNRSLRGL